MKFHYSILLLLFLLLIGCEGKRGPTGPQGPPGSLTKIIYNGTASSDEFVINIPELHIDDFPSINCYYLYEGAWSELYLDYERNSEVMYPYALIEEQNITLYQLNGLPYKIILVI